MALATIILAFLTLITICLAEILSFTSHGASSSLSTVFLSPGQTHDTFRFLPPLLGSNESEDLQLLDVVLVASVDGKFHALNRTSGEALWSMSSSSAPSPPGLAPLVRTTHTETDPEMTDEDSPHQELYVIEPQTGEIFVMSSPTSPLQRLPLSMSQLVDLSPFTFSGDDDERVFIGRKETSLLLIELETGRVKATVNSACPWDPFEELVEKDPPDSDPDDSDTKIPRPKSTGVFIGRTGE
jgi:serine/threonine-protein kinase/endoribonuclease IRE1